jgi:hypothetical protein
VLLVVVSYNCEVTERDMTMYLDLHRWNIRVFNPSKCQFFFVCFIGLSISWICFLVLTKCLIANIWLSCQSAKVCVYQRHQTHDYDPHRQLL